MPTLRTSLTAGLLTTSLAALLACGGAAESPGTRSPNQETALRVAPASASVSAGESVAFTSAVAGSAGASVTWSIQEGNAGGAITSGGLYTAPAVSGTFHVVAQSVTDPTQSATASVTVTGIPASDMGTGYAHAPQYVSVSGAGAMPSVADAAVAACAGDGSTDDTGCLQAAIDSARAAGKALAIPATGSSYSIRAPLKVTTSVIGTNGIPTIRTTSSGSGYDEQGAILHVAASNLWIANLHLAGTYGGGGASTGAQSAGPNISLGNVSNITIKGNLLEGAQGDSISDHYQEMDGGAGGLHNLLVAGNTLVQPYRCCMSLVDVVDGIAVVDNVCDKEGNDTSSPFDWEPWHAESSITNVEVAYNQVTLWAGTSPDSAPVNVSGWSDSTPGGNIYTHHNYGSWPSNSYGGAFTAVSGNWYGVVSTSNVRGTTPPP